MTIELWEIFGLCLAAATIVGLAVVGAHCLWCGHDALIEEAAPYLAAIAGVEDHTIREASSTLPSKDDQ